MYDSLKTEIRTVLATSGYGIAKIDVNLPDFEFPAMFIGARDVIIHVIPYPENQVI